MPKAAKCLRSMALQKLFPVMCFSVLVAGVTVGVTGGGGQHPGGEGDAGGDGQHPGGGGVGGVPLHGRVCHRQIRLHSGRGLCPPVSAPS